MRHPHPIVFDPRPIEPTNRERVLLAKPVLTALDGVLRAFRLRDRLRCPHCRAVGTFKPHGTRFDTADIRHVGRWLCKWCGYYLGPEGVTLCVLDDDTRTWSFGDEYGGWTPQDSFALGPVGWANPWGG